MLEALNDPKEEEEEGRNAEEAKMVTIYYELLLGTTAVATPPRSLEASQEC